MNRFQLNFLNTSSKIEERKRYKRISGGSFLLIFIFSLYVVFQVFFAQYYMVDTYKTKLASISSKVSVIEPRIKYLEGKISERNRLNKQLDEFLQTENRAAVWVPRLLDIANLLPPDVRIESIVYKKPKNPDTDPSMVINGEHILKKSNQDYNFLDNMIQAWTTSLPVSSRFATIRIIENNIIKEKDEIKITFSIGFYTS